MEMAIVMARNSGMDWILHLDTDELINPAGGGEYSLRKLLHDIPRDVDMVVFPNYVRNPNCFLTYRNGKSIARVQDHLRPNGAHRWHNYMKTPKYVAISFLLIL
ncbi:hypothetical protein L2E82_30118 [Cichorium intybus]|uniref:Uncharacterized protein n=1 Tax=Cichorium intybus TaxID=13427 RepID=A0ACB9D057_CICIN|nr:hypothetical protein L2E82_30118 [Cichorium intybus]